MISRPIVLLGAMAAASVVALGLLAGGSDIGFDLAKPAPMILALATLTLDGPADRLQRGLMIAGAAGSLAGDILLELDGVFIFGLAAFLVTHLAYLAAFRRDVEWFPSKLALVAILAIAGAVAAAEAPHLPQGLLVPVLAYVAAIALMVAQAAGRAVTLGTGPARAVGIGAAFFLVSDGILSWDRFVGPIPAGGMLVMATYYASQVLVVAGMTLRADPSGP